MTSAPTDAAAEQFDPPPQPTSRNVSSPLISRPAKREIDLNSFATTDLLFLGPHSAGARTRAGKTRYPCPIGFQTIHRSAREAALNITARSRAARVLDNR